MNEPLHNPSQAMSSLICFDPAQGPPKQARPLTGQGEHPTLTSPCVRADSTGIVNMENLKFKICTNEKFTTSSYKNSSKPPQDQNGFLLCLSVRVLPTKFLAQLSTYPLLSSFTATARPPARARRRRPRVGTAPRQRCPSVRLSATYASVCIQGLWFGSSENSHSQLL